MQHLFRNRAGAILPLALVVLVFGSAAMANRAPLPPEPEPAPEPAPGVLQVKAVAEPNERFDQMRLVLPKQVAAQLGITTDDKARAEAESDSGSRTVVAGLSLSAAIILGGFALLRPRNGSRNTTAMLLIAALSLSIGGYAVTATADIAIPNPPKPTPSGKTFGLKIVIDDKAKDVTLHATEGQFKQMEKVFEDSAEKAFEEALR